MKAPYARLLALLLAAGPVPAGAHAKSAPAPPSAAERIVCLGDSITDGYTYAQIITQALREAGKPVPTIVCAGVASDTAPQMAARLEATVLRFKPTLVTFSAGTNDSLRTLSPAVYEKALRTIAGKVKAAGGRMVLLTPCIICPRKGATEADRAKVAAAGKLIAEYAKVIRRVAAEEKCPVAENRKLMRAARASGKELMAADGIHPNYFGQSLMARAILDAMDLSSVPLPREFKPPLLPGVVRVWRMRPAPKDAAGKPRRLTAEAAGRLRPDDTWKTYTLPDPAPASRPSAEDWWEQTRRNGFGLRVHERVGRGLVQAVAVLASDAPAKVYVNTGVGIATVWLNGRKVHEQPKAWTGFHAGKERIPVELRKGKNILAVEIDGPQFFLSVTDELIWEEQLK